MQRLNPDANAPNPKAIDGKMTKESKSGGYTAGTPSMPDICVIGAGSGGNMVIGISLIFARD